MTQKPPLALTAIGRFFPFGQSVERELLAHAIAGFNEGSCFMTRDGHVYLPGEVRAAMSSPK